MEDRERGVEVEAPVTVELLESIGKQRHTEEHFDHISQWYDCLGSSHTFKTVFVELSRDQCVAIAKTRENGRNISTLWRFLDESSTEEDRQKIRDMDPRGMLNEHQQACLQEAEEGLDDAVRAAGGRAFVRLDTRSPKDAILNRPLLLKELADELERQFAGDGRVQRDEAFRRMGLAYWRAFCTAGAVESGEDALDLMLASNRVQEDIQLSQLSQDSGLQVAAREWAVFWPEYEFRAFVVRNKITAITQYHESLYIPSHSRMKDQLRSAMLAKFEEVKELISAPQGCYTIDFIVHADLSGDEPALTGEVSVVEINDPPPTAGTSLFDWDNEADQQEILGGDAVLRVVEDFIHWETQVLHMHPPIVEWFDGWRARRAARGSHCTTM